MKKSKVSNLNDLEMNDYKGGTGPSGSVYGTIGDCYLCTLEFCWTMGCATGSCESNNNPPGCWSYPQCCG